MQECTPIREVISETTLSSTISLLFLHSDKALLFIIARLYLSLILFGPAGHVAGGGFL